MHWKSEKLCCWSRAENTKAVPLTCHGHSRPVTHLSFSSIVDDDQYYLISACKGLDPADCLFRLILISKRQQPHASRWRYWWLVSGQSRWIAESNLLTVSGLAHSLATKGQYGNLDSRWMQPLLQQLRQTSQRIDPCLSYTLSVN